MRRQVATRTIGLILAALLAPPAAFANEATTPGPGAAPPVQAQAAQTLPPAPAEFPIRVGVGRNVASAQIKAAEGMYIIAEGAIHWQTPPGTTVTLKVAAGKVQVEGLRDHFTGPVRLVPVAPAADFVSFKQRHYRGEIEVLVNPKNPAVLSVVNVVNLEEYLRGVVPAEMPALWHEEALKAQAVASRGFAITSLPSAYVAEGFQLMDSTVHQAYGGKDAEHPRGDAAVAATAGQVVKHSGQLAKTFFSASSGGHTESSNIIWGGDKPLPHLIGVPDADNLEANWRYAWSESLTPTEASAGFADFGHNVGLVTSIQPVAPIGVSGRPAKWMIVGSTGTKTITGEQMRSSLGLMSSPRSVSLAPGGTAPATKTYTAANSFTVLGAGGKTATRSVTGAAVLTAQGQTVTLPAVVTAVGPTTQQAAGVVAQGGGYGHSVGMSQWGAYGLALQGKTYTEILTHFYQGTKVEKF